MGDDLDPDDDLEPITDVDRVDAARVNRLAARLFSAWLAHKLNEDSEHLKSFADDVLDELLVDPDWPGVVVWLLEGAIQLLKGVAIALEEPPERVWQRMALRLASSLENGG
jgi:hypothetical protein